MALKFFKTTALPSAPTEADNGIYFIKSNGQSPFRFYIVQSPNTYEIDAVSASQLASALSLKADDNAVVKITGTQTIAGLKTFSSIVKVPAGVAAGDAVNKGQMDAADSNLQTQISNLETTVASGMKAPLDINASTNPNYPASTVGSTYIITGAGKIGGALGPDVTVGDMIVAKAQSPGGTHALEGSKFFIVQSNVHDATESVSGYVRFATDAQTVVGTVKDLAVHPSGVTAAIDAVAVKLTGNQTIAGKKTFSTVPASSQAAAAATDLVRKGEVDSALTLKANDTDVVKLTGNQSVDGIKTFVKAPIVPTAVAATEAVNKGQLDAAILAGNTNLVTTNTAQNITAVKTFTASPIVPTATTNTQAVNKGQMDAANLALDNLNLHKAGAETITGIKTFDAASTPLSLADATLANQLVRFSQMQAAIALATIDWTTDNWA